MSLRKDHFFYFGSFFSFSFTWGGNHHPPCPSSKLPQIFKRKNNFPNNLKVNTVVKYGIFFLYVRFGRATKLSVRLSVDLLYSDNWFTGIRRIVHMNKGSLGKNWEITYSKEKMSHCWTTRKPSTNNRRKLQIFENSSRNIETFNPKQN
jgi:hypothetical protein